MGPPTPDALSARRPSRPGQPTSCEAARRGTMGTAGVLPGGVDTMVLLDGIAVCRHLGFRLAGTKGEVCPRHRVPVPTRR